MPNEKNYADDFANALHGQTPTARRGLPPLHPREGDRWVNLAADDGALPPGEEANTASLNLLELPKTKQMVVRYGQFSLNDPTQVGELEEIMNNCVSKRGWILAREEWDINAKGNKVVTLKYIEVLDKGKKAKEAKEKAGAGLPPTPAST